MYPHSGDKPKIIFDGDTFCVAFMLPEHSIIAGRGCPSAAQMFWLAVGSTHMKAFVRHIIKQRNNPSFKDDDNLYQLSKQMAGVDSESVRKLFQLQRIDETPDITAGDQTLPCVLRVMGQAAEFTMGSPISASPAMNKLPWKEDAPRGDDILVNWFSGRQWDGKLPEAPHRCGYYIQVGTPRRAIPSGIACPKHVQIIVSNLSEHEPDARIRKRLSYEAIAVDLLRLLRGRSRTPTLSPVPDFKERLGLPTQPASGYCQYFVVVFRINSSATLVFRHAGQNLEDEKAFLIYRKDRAAPLDSPALGWMQGYGSLLGAHLAAHAFLEAARPKEAHLLKPDDWINEAVGHALMRKYAYFKRGFFHLFFKPNPSGISWDPDETILWEQHENWFNDLSKSVGDLNNGDWIKNIQIIDIPIFGAVSHRKTWHITSTLIRKQRPPPKANGETGDEEATKEDFQQVAVSWLSAKDRNPDLDVPIVKIGDLRLVDRREIEDYLAIHEALTNYIRAKDEKPLSVAVFGPPGSGKSFGVNQVAGHISKNTKSFSEHPLTFNIGQFTKLDDLVNAMHRVRDERLRAGIPVVFFDEFDAALDGRPFGWLKYFLAPMQDGQFLDGSTTFHLGKCVMVFAGGVNRSFEEMNGRLRNLSFCEAKGPDFISRLRAHLNIRGINAPDDQSDAGLYILRRAIVLHDKLKKLLDPGDKRPPNPLMHERVARAFCHVSRFKHGFRSMESILNMCEIRPGYPLGPSDLPAKAQLEMHVDAAQFLELVMGSSDDQMKT
jgi:hypothetical protein